LAALLATGPVSANKPAGVWVDPDRFSSASTPCVAVLNQRAYGIAEYVTPEGEVVMRSGSWLGRHSAFVLPPPDPGVRVRLVSLGEKPAKAEDFRLEACPDRFPGAAVGALAQAQQHRLARYLGEEGVADAATIETWLELAVEALDGSGHAFWAGVAHFESAAFLRREGRLGEARERYEAAQARFETAQAPDQRASSLNSQGLVAWREARTDAAEALFLKALAIRERRGDGFEVAAIANNLGLLAHQRGDPDAAAEFYEYALGVFQGDLDLRGDLSALSAGELSDLELQAIDLASALNTLNNLARVQRARGQRDVAERYWRNYIALAPRLPNPSAGAEARLNLALLLLGDGRLDEALVQALDARSVFEQAGNARWLADSLSVLGRIYLVLGDDQLAENFARRALATAGDHVKMQAVAWSLLASVSRARNDWTSALDVGIRSLALWEQLEAQEALIRVRSELAWTRFRQGQARRAMSELEAVLGEFDGRIDDRAAAAITSRIGAIQLELGDPSAARATLGEALVIQRRVGDVLGQFETLKRLARVWRALDDPAELEAYRQAIERVEAVYAADLPPLRRAGFLAASREVYDDLILALVAQGQHDEAFRVAGQARARGLRGLKYTRRRRLSDPRRRELLDRRARLLNERFARAEPIYTEGGGAARQTNPAWKLEIDRIDVRLERLSASVAPDTDPPALSTVQSALAPDTLFLSYYLAGDRMLVWSITPDSARLVELEESSGLEAAAAELQRRLRHPRQALGAMHRAAETLQSALLKPLRRDLELADSIRIQADGLLHSVPFALLLAQAGIESKPIVRVHGGLQGSDQAGDETVGSRLLVLADPGWNSSSAEMARMYPENSLLGRLVRDESLGQLPGSRREAEAIARLGGDHRTVELRLGRRATREFVVNGGLSGRRRIHIATHGLVDLDYPELSSLLLASETALGPAFLRPRDIAELDLDADLVTLSGCETGLGRILAGEGAMSLARPFLIAGARQVLASLWKIDDHHTALFMERFYRDLLIEGRSAAEALAAARAWTRKQPATAHPYYWAGFVLTRSDQVAEPPDDALTASRERERDSGGE
jgi:CHAT domain-containing protein